MTKKSLKDPKSNKTVRFTDNSAKDQDFYPEDQSTKVLMLDPVGAPYSQMEELTGLSLGDSEERVRQWALMQALSDEFDRLEAEQDDRNTGLEDDAYADS